MDGSQMNRRDFQRLTAAALGGVIGGSMHAPPRRCGRRHGEVAAGRTPRLSRAEHLQGEKRLRRDQRQERHVPAKAAAPRPRSTTAKARIPAKGQGGCGEHPGENTCKAKGSCEVPLKDKAWDKARANFEAAMKKAGKKFGPAPKKS